MSRFLFKRSVYSIWSIQLSFSQPAEHMTFRPRWTQARLETGWNTQRWWLWQNCADIRKEAEGPIHTVPEGSVLLIGKGSTVIESSHTHRSAMTVRATLPLNSNDLTKTIYINQLWTSPIQGGLGMTEHEEKWNINGASWERHKQIHNH